MIFILFLIATFAFAFLWWEFNDSPDDRLSLLSCFSLVASILLGIISFILLFDIIYANTTAEGFIEANKQRYSSLVYQVENDVYNNDNDIGKKELYEKVTNWNTDLAKGKALQRNFWVGIFYPNIYDEFEFIELPKN